MGKKMFGPGDQVYAIGLGYHILYTTVKSVVINPENGNPTYYTLEVPRGYIDRYPPEKIFDSFIEVSAKIREHITDCKERSG